jgi:hypothetical protein
MAALTTLEERCVECRQTCYFEKADYAHTFGHIYSVDGLRTFLVVFMCEFCQEILADFGTMNVRRDQR